MSEQTHNTIYDRNVIEYMTIVGEFCGYLENCQQKQTLDFTDKMTKLVAALYLKTLLLPDFEFVTDNEPDHFVSEEEYTYVLSNVIAAMGQHDDYLEVFDAEIQYSDGPIRKTVSENLADIYQELKDFIEAFQIGTEDSMNDALAFCQQNFRETWGQKLVNVLRALHEVRFKIGDEEDDETLQANPRNNIFTRMQQQWNEEEED